MTMRDPFAAPPAEEAQQPEIVGGPAVLPGTSPWEAPAPPLTLGVQPLPAEPELGITLKADGAPPWITYRSASVDDALKLFNEDGTKLAALMDRVQKANAHFAAGFTVPSGGGGNTGGGSNVPPAAAQPPAGAPASPGAGWEFKSGVSKAGKAWKAWMPPKHLKDSGTKPIFFD